MTKQVQHTKPFNFDHAHAGAPYCCASGQKTTILKWDCREENFELTGVYGEFDKTMRWNLSGISTALGMDLVMLPLGVVDGSSVFTGDVLVDINLATVVIRAKQRDFSMLSWPTAYPTTNMSIGELTSAYFGGGPVVGDCGETKARYRIANDAIRKAIITGRVIERNSVLRFLQDMVLADSILLQNNCSREKVK